MSTTVNKRFRSANADFTFRLITEVCCNCGCVFAMPEDFRDQRLSDHGWFYCPAGHSQHYTENETERKLRVAQERLASEREWARRMEQDLHAERKAHASTKGNLTKARKRAAHGVCLHCNRTFANVARHVQSQHPEEAAGPR